VPCARPANVRRARRLEESQRLRAIAHQQVLGLLIVPEGEFVCFAAKAGLFGAEEELRRVIRERMLPATTALRIVAL